MKSPKEDARYTEFGRLVAASPAQAVRRMFKAYRAAGARYMGPGGAAELLGVSPTQWREFVRVLDVRPELARMKAEAVAGGWHHVRLGGRPRKEARA